MHLKRTQNKSKKAFLPYHKFIVPLIALGILLNTWCSASAATDGFAEQMKFNYSLFLKKDYLKALKGFDSIYWTSKAYYNDALFYIIVCQDKLNLLEGAKANIKLLKVQLLSTAKQAIIQGILLKPTPIVAVWNGIPPKTNFFEAAFNAGAATYSPSSVNTGGFFYGLAASWADLTQKLTLTYDRLNLSQNPAQVYTPSNFNQDQVFISYGRTLGEHFSSKVTATQLYNTDSSTRWGGTLGATLKYFNQNFIYVGTEFYYSAYPNYNFIPAPAASNLLAVFQANLDLGFLLTSNSIYTLYLDLKGIAIRPTHVDDTALLSFNQNYASGDLNLRLYSGQATYTLGGWWGKQLFAVQGEGHDLFNIGNSRTWKISSSYSYTFLSGITFTLFAATEAILETAESTSNPLASASNPTKSQLYAGGSALVLSF